VIPFAVLQVRWRSFASAGDPVKRAGRMWWPAEPFRPIAYRVARLRSEIKRPCSGTPGAYSASALAASAERLRNLGHQAQDLDQGQQEEKSTEPQRHSHQRNDPRFWIAPSQDRQDPSRAAIPVGQQEPNSLPATHAPPRKKRLSDRCTTLNRRQSAIVDWHRRQA